MYAQFGFSDHNGVDVAMTPTKRVAAPFRAILIGRGYQPNGGGIYLQLMSVQKYHFGVSAMGQSPVLLPAPVG